MYTGAFGAAQDTISVPGADDGVYMVIDLVSEEETLTALKIKKWGSSLVKFKVTDFFVDSGSRNFIQDVTEPTVDACTEMDPGPYSIYVTRVSYSDDDSTGSFTAADTILEVERSMPCFFELTDESVIYALIPDSIPASQPGSPQKVKIKGLNLGTTQGSSLLHIGGKTWSVDHRKIKVWQDDKIKFKVTNYNPPFPKYKDIWVTVNGQKSNKVELEITAP